jgi:hypothetical protein
MIQRTARVDIVAIFAGMVLVLAAYASAWFAGGAPVWGVVLMIAGSALSMAAMLGLGARNSHVARVRARWLVCFLFVVVAAGFGAPLILPAETATSPLLFGLPLRAAIEIYGVGILPILVLPWVYALEFRADGLDEAALASLRQRCVEAMRQ